jgi:hypothetical protein
MQSPSIRVNTSDFLARSARLSTAASNNCYTSDTNIKVNLVPIKWSGLEKSISKRLTLKNRKIN